MSEEMYEQMSLWEDILPTYKLKEPVILLEMFAGIGAQRKALSILGIKVDEEKSNELSGNATSKEDEDLNVLLKQLTRYLENK